jgi:hypothetical protein
VLGDVRKDLLKHGEHVLSHLVGDERIDQTLEAQLRGEAERFARRIDLGKDVDAKASLARRLQCEDRVAKLADRLVELGGGVSDPVVQVILGRRRHHGLQLQPRRKEALDHLVVEVTGDAAPILEHRQLLHAFDKSRLVDRDACG